MQSLFRLEPETNAGSIELRQWPYATAGLLQNVEKIEQYYRDYPTAVASSHLLVRLIQSIAVSRKLSYDRYVANCTAVSLNVAQSLKLTSGLSKGQVWDGEFYGSGSKEIIIGHDTLFPIYEAYENWQNLHPVTVLQHNQTNTALMLPDGRVSSTDKGVSIIAINIPMLMAMYYCFNEEQDNEEANGRPRRTIYQFVCSYALAGMMRSHLDCVVFNRLYNKVTGVPMVPAIRKHSFFLVDYDAALDVAADQQLENMRNLKKRFAGVLKSVKMPMSKDMWEFSQLPSVPETLQAEWALVLARIKVIAFLCLAQKDYERINNRELTTIRRVLRMQQTRQVIKNNLGMEAYFQVASYLDIVGVQ
jgi:hypothetical protein